MGRGNKGRSLLFLPVGLPKGGCTIRGHASGDSISGSAGEIYEFCAKNIIMTGARSVRGPMRLKLISIFLGQVGSCVRIAFIK